MLAGSTGIAPIIRRLDSASDTTITLLALALVGVAGSLDYVTGKHVSFSIFYLIPISLVATFIGRGAGIAFSVFCAGLWGSLDVLSGQEYPHWSYVVWNSAIRCAFFLVTTFLLVALRRAYQELDSLARTDSLTGCTNRRALVEILGMEIERSRRTARPFALAYADLDDFKGVNDTQGHGAGDAVLRAVADAARRRLRRTDAFARIGGDEFAVLLPEAGVTEAETVLKELHAEIVAAVAAGNWATGISMGAVVFNSPPRDPEDALRYADDLVRDIKGSGKRAIALAVATQPADLTVARHRG